MALAAAATARPTYGSSDRFRARVSVMGTPKLNKPELGQGRPD
jgi:hypothetical protein